MAVDWASSNPSHTKVGTWQPVEERWWKWLNTRLYEWCSNLTKSSGSLQIPRPKRNLVMKRSGSGILELLNRKSSKSRLPVWCSGRILWFLTKWRNREAWHSLDEWGGKLEKPQSQSCRHGAGGGWARPCPRCWSTSTWSLASLIEFQNSLRQLFMCLTLRTL